MRTSFGGASAAIGIERPGSSVRVATIADTSSAAMAIGPPEARGDNRRLGQHVLADRIAGIDHHLRRRRAHVLRRGGDAEREDESTGEADGGDA